MDELCRLVSDSWPVEERSVVKSHWITLVSVIAAMFFLLLSRRLDLLLVVVPVSALIGGLAALEGVFGQRRI